MSVSVCVWVGYITSIINFVTSVMMMYVCLYACTRDVFMDKYCADEEAWICII